MTEDLGRRAANKARTRDAIIEALRVLLAQHATHEVTVEQIAETAGISRRTFFNYHSGLQSVISEVIGTYTAHIVDAVGELDGTAPVSQLRELLTTVGIPAGLLQWIALIHRHDADEDLFALALERAVWQEKGLWLERELAARLPAGTDDLYVATLASVVMNSFAVAEQAWVADRDPLATVDERSLAAFHRLLDQALTYAEQGWSVSEADTSTAG